MGTQNNGDWYNFAKFTPFNQREYYHDYCLITDFSNQSMVSTYMTECTSCILWGALSVLMWYKSGANKNWDYIMH